jgi:hypothetical protein
MRIQEAVGTAFERVHRAGQTFRGALAGAETQSALVLAHRHPIDSNVGPVPIAANALAQGEIPQAETAALLVELAGEVFQSMPLHSGQPLVWLVATDIASR